MAKSVTQTQAPAAPTEPVQGEVLDPVPEGVAAVSSTDAEPADVLHGETLEGGDDENPTMNDGSRMRRAFMMKMLLPNKEWITMNVVSKGQGARAVIGRVFGPCMGAELKTNRLPNGDLSESVVLHGEFEGTSYVTGEVINASMAYLPRAFSDRVYNVLNAKGTDVRSVIVDVDIGLEATGKTIMYEWIVISYVDGRSAGLMRRLRAARKPPTQLLTGPGATA